MKEHHNPSDFSDIEEYIEYSGDRVVCTTKEINSDMTVYLANCTVGGEAVEEYTYGNSSSVAACEFEDGTYGAAGQIGAKYHCDTDGDGTKDNYFYLLNNASPYNLIMDRNYTDDFVPATMVWCNPDEPNPFNNSGCQDNLNQYLEYIEELWTNVDSVSLPTANQIAHAVGNTTWDSTNGSTWFYLDSKTQTHPVTSKGSSNYAWLFDYTRRCESDGCNVEDSSNQGYWTSSSYADSSVGAWFVTCAGNLDGGIVVSTVMFGVRPVITISNLD